VGKPHSIYATERKALVMLKVWTSSDSYVKPAVQLSISLSGDGNVDWIIRNDPLLRFLWGNYDGNPIVASLDPRSVKSLLEDSVDHGIAPLEISRSPRNSKFKDNSLYDEQHYGSFLDSIQGFWSVLNGGDLALDPPYMVHSQHYVRHKTFKGQAYIGTIDQSDSTYELSVFNTVFHLPRYPALSKFRIDPNGSVGFNMLDIGHVYDIIPLFTWLARKGDVTYSYPTTYGDMVVTVSGFHYANTSQLEFGYSVDMDHVYQDVHYPHTWNVSYSAGGLSIISDEGVSPEVRTVRFGTTSRTYEVSNHVSPLETPDNNFTLSPEGADLAYILAIPIDSPTRLVAQQQVSDFMQEYGLPFWESVNLHWSDITALSRDTTTIALTRLASQAYDPSFARIGAINPLKSAGDSLFAKTADAALGDFFRTSWKKILGWGGGAGLVRYRTLFSDCLQLINSLEVLRDLQKSPSRLYVASANYDYPVLLGGRDCVIHVRSKAYLVLSPFGLIRILIGRQAIVILNDLIALYLTSAPLGEILLTLLQLRRVGDYISSRMYYDLPLFFVHVYEVESQLTKAELDDTGMSNISGDPVRLIFYARDVSQYLPTLRFSNLVSFYGTGDVGNIVWSLLQQLVGVLSSSI
jgi:hypothetical protein